MAGYGLKLIGHLYGTIHNARIHKYFVPSSDGTAIFLGDAVKSGGTADSATGEPTVTQAAAGDTIRGVVVGVDPIQGVAIGSENLNRIYRPASTAMYLYVCDDPYAVFQVSCSGTVTAAMVGENADITVGSGSTTTGLSAMQLDVSSHVTSSAQLRILGGTENIGATNLGSATADVRVMINEHELKSTSGV